MPQNGVCWLIWQCVWWCLCYLVLREGQGGHKLVTGAAVGVSSREALHQRTARHNTSWHSTSQHGTAHHVGVGLSVCRKHTTCHVCAHNSASPGLLSLHPPTPHSNPFDSQPTTTHAQCGKVSCAPCAAMRSNRRGLNMPAGSYFLDRADSFANSGYRPATGHLGCRKVRSKFWGERGAKSDVSVGRVRKEGRAGAIERG